MNRRAAVLTAALMLLQSYAAAAKEDADVEIEAVATHTERYARAFQAPLGALYWWIALNQESQALPLYADLQPHMFAPASLPGYQVAVSAVASGVVQLCVSVQLNDRLQAAGFAAGANRVGAELANAGACAADNGAAVRAPGFPRMAAMTRIVDKRRVVSSAVLPGQPLVGLPENGVVDVSLAAPSQVLTVTNNTVSPLTLVQASVSDALFSLGSTCQAGVVPAGTCEIEVALSGAVAVKKVARVQLIFSNGSSAFFSVRGRP